MVVLGTIGKCEAGNDEAQLYLDEAPADEMLVFHDLKADTSLSSSFLFSMCNDR